MAREKALNDSPDLTDPRQQAAYVQDAVDERDPFLIVQAMKEIGLMKRVPVCLDENPPLSEFLRDLAGLGLRIEIVVSGPDNGR